MTAPDETMIRIGRAIELAQRGEHAEARRLFAGLWDEVEPGGDPLHRLSVAHWMADLQDDPRDELAWDLRALEAASLVTDERATRAGVAGRSRGSSPRSTSIWARITASSATWRPPDATSHRDKPQPRV